MNNNTNTQKNTQNDYFLQLIYTYDDDYSHNITGNELDRLITIRIIGASFSILIKLSSFFFSL